MVVMLFPFDEGVELGSANAGETVGGTENGAGGSIADDDNAGLVACHQRETVGSKAGAKLVAIGAGRPRCPNILASLSQIDAKAFAGLMRLAGIGRN